MSGISGETGFAAQIGQLENSAPGLAAGKPATVSPTLDSLSAARSAGVTSQAQVLFSLLGTRRIDRGPHRARQKPCTSRLSTCAPRSSIRSGRPSRKAKPWPSKPPRRPSPPQGTKMPPGATPKATAAEDAQTLAATRKDFDASDREVQSNLGRLRPAQPGDDGPRSGSGQPAGMASGGRMKSTSRSCAPCYFGSRESPSRSC